MTWKGALLTIPLGLSLLASERGIVRMPDDPDSQQPGMIRLQGIREGDEVRVDGELVPAKGLKRTGYRLLIAPGEYNISIRAAGSEYECVSYVDVKPGETTRPACLSETARLAD